MVEGLKDKVPEDIFLIHGLTFVSSMVYCWYDPSLINPWLPLNTFVHHDGVWMKKVKHVVHNCTSRYYEAMLSWSSYLIYQGCMTQLHIKSLNYILKQTYRELCWKQQRLPSGNVSLWSPFQQFLTPAVLYETAGIEDVLTVCLWLTGESWTCLCWACFNLPIHLSPGCLSTSNFTCAAVPSISIYIKGCAPRSSSPP